MLQYCLRLLTKHSSGISTRKQGTHGDRAVEGVHFIAQCLILTGLMAHDAPQFRQLKQRLRFFSLRSPQPHAQLRIAVLNVLRLNMKPERSVQTLLRTH